MIIKSKKCLFYNSIENYQISDVKINEFITKKIKKMKIYETSDDFPLENSNKSEICKIYKKILDKSDFKNYISMLCIIIQKTLRIDINIENKTIGGKIVYTINQNLFNASLKTDKNNAKETKNLFCLKLLLKYFPFFCKILYYYIHEVNYFQTRIQNKFYEQDDIKKKTGKNFRHFINYREKQKKNLEVDNLDLKNINDSQNFNESNNLINSENETNNNFDDEDKDFFGILKNFQKKIILCEIKEEKIKIEKYNPIIKENINDYYFQGKTLIQILKEVLFIKLNKVLFQSILINGKKIKINGKLKNSKFSYKYTLFCINKDFAINYIALILIKKLIPKLYENMVNYYNKLNDNNNQEFLEDENEENIFWEILDKSKNYQKGISSYEIDGNIKEFKNIILQKDFSKKIDFYFLDKKKFIFGGEFNDEILFEFFKSLGFEFKMSIENDEVFNICYLIKYYRKSISIKIQVDNKNLINVLKISVAKLIEIIFPSKIFDIFTKKFITEKIPKKDHKEFFSQFNCLIIEKKIPKYKFLNSDKKISFLKDYDPKENNLQDILFKIGDFFDTEINFDFKEDKRISIYNENDKENGYLFLIDFEDKEKAVDFMILKFLELEFNDLFEFISNFNITD